MALAHCSLRQAGEAVGPREVVVLRSFVQWFEGHILAAGLIGLVDAVLGIFAFGAILAALTGGTALKAAAVVVAILVMMGVPASLIASRTREREEQERYRQLVSRYCDTFQRLRGAPMQIAEWDDVRVVDERGDVVNTVNILAKVQDSEMRFARFRIGSNWDQPVGKRKKVECVARSGRAGPRYDTTTSWLSDGRLEVIVHLPFPVTIGADIRVVLEVAWPGMSAPLITKRQPDDYFLKFARNADLVRYVIVLPKGESVLVGRIGFDENDDGYRVEMVRNVVGRVEVVLTARDVPAKHRFGLRLELE